MSTPDPSQIHARRKQTAGGRWEHTRPGYVFTPDVDIYETEQALVLVADMPGVTAENLSIDLHENILTLVGESSHQAADREQTVSAEYRTGKYYRQFNVPDLIDQSRIDAKLGEGVLTLTLPKVRKATPRKIVVRSD